MLYAFIVEDEQFAREELKYLLTETGDIEIIGESETMHEALWDIHECQPDVVFLDIQLAKGNGMELAKQFKHMKKQPMIVFATAYDAYALDAFDLDAIDYIVKPIDGVRLRKTVDKLLVHAQFHRGKPQQEDIQPQGTKTIPVKDDDRMIIVQVDEIYYIGTENRQTYIKTAQHKYETDLLLYQILEKLGDDFLQVHRGYIVNLKQVSAIEPWLNRAYNLILKDGSKVPISRSYAKHVKQKLGIK
ncbi:LytR/AlgR family response regulator transcription factor [Heyndrickxia oleronia]|uniref:LytR/AlgR family response regulator transcription factor n=1 Tax=Heyndrickxia oleronia TaxID=38875 RepID=UPI001C0EA961|nr:LytTR family DNA-binding domain-containing protein [Heyndrickxia oleronia]MBU5214867.1 LytTR family DNA-binding domain-containing protein [Heyndrickxia oleronia]